MEDRNECTFILGYEKNGLFVEKKTFRPGWYNANDMKLFAQGIAIGATAYLALPVVQVLANGNLEFSTTATKTKTSKH